MERELIVLPKSRREAILKLAHDSSGHLSSRKVISVLRGALRGKNVGKMLLNFADHVWYVKRWLRLEGSELLW